jgi:hypothetical protein
VLNSESHPLMESVNYIRPLSCNYPRFKLRGGTHPTIIVVFSIQGKGLKNCGMSRMGGDATVTEEVKISSCESYRHLVKKLLRMRQYGVIDLFSATSSVLTASETDSNVL